MSVILQQAIVAILVLSAVVILYLELRGKKKSGGCGCGKGACSKLTEHSNNKG
ncbi:MAG: FeoB-associated Cys-rich membrane protein [Candidatus Sumerlaeia bacterium]|nr:FeoB-associated Cys-rich membrane protein [Candidatus Sumerlaeia bacterium]